MAGAMVKGILGTGPWKAVDIRCTGAQDGTAEALAAATGIQYTYDYGELLAGARWIILACKPQQIGQLPAELPQLSRGRKVLSILAGTPLQRLRKVFPESDTLVRCMPNTPGMIGAGITAYSTETTLSNEEVADVEAILGALGEALPMPEASLDAVTGLSGSGPAYVFEFVAALRDGGIEAGLDAETAYRLALKTVQGAAALLEKVPESPETHRNWVSSPGGTTLAGLAVMEREGFRSIIKETVQAATRRSRELA